MSQRGSGAEVAAVGSGPGVIVFADLRDEAAELLAPVDLQAIKAAGVTFARSMVERVIEEVCHMILADPAELFDENGNVLAVRDMPDYVGKYAEGIRQINLTVERYSDMFSAVIRVQPLKLRGLPPLNI